MSARIDYGPLPQRIIVKKPTGPSSQLRKKSVPRPKFNQIRPTKSAADDLVDDIYTFNDPISVSIKQRLDDAGYAEAVVHKKNKKAIYFYEMALVGHGCPVPVRKTKKVVGVSKNFKNKVLGRKNKN